MASLTHWTRVWASSGRWWRTGKPGVLQSMGHKESDMAEQLHWTELKPFSTAGSARTWENAAECWIIKSVSSVWQYPVEEFFVYDHEGYWFIIFFSSRVFGWFWYQGYAGTSSPIFLAVGATLLRLYQWMRISPVSCPSSHSFFFQRSMEKRFQVAVNYFYISSYQWLYAWLLVIH